MWYGQKILLLIVIAALVAGCAGQRRLVDEQGRPLIKKIGTIDIDMVDDLFSNRILWWWDEYMKPFFLKFHERVNDPTMYDSIESLTDEIKMRRLFKEEERRKHMTA